MTQQQQQGIQVATRHRPLNDRGPDSDRLPAARIFSFPPTAVHRALVNCASIYYKALSCASSQQNTKPTRDKASYRKARRPFRAFLSDGDFPLPSRAASKHRASTEIIVAVVQVKLYQTLEGK